MMLWARGTFLSEGSGPSERQTHHAARLKPILAQRCTNKRAPLTGSLGFERHGVHFDPVDDKPAVMSTVRGQRLCLEWEARRGSESCPFYPVTEKPRSAIALVW